MLDRREVTAITCTLCGWAKPWHATRCLVWKAYDAIHAPDQNGS